MRFGFTSLLIAAISIAAWWAWPGADSPRTDGSGAAIVTAVALEDSDGAMEDAGAKTVAAGHRHGDGCDPIGPVRITAMRVGDAFEVETSTTLPYRGELRVTSRLPQGVRWVDDAASWVGEGKRTLRFDGEAFESGELEVRMVSLEGEVFVDQAALEFLDAPNSVREAFAIDEERIGIPGVTRREGGAK